MPMILAGSSRLSGSVTETSRAGVADDVVVGEDVAVGRHEHARAEALLQPVAVAERTVAAEEIPEERIVDEGGVRRADHLRRRDVRHARNRDLRGLCEVWQTRRSRWCPLRGRCRRRRFPCSAASGCAAASSALRIRPVKTSPATEPTRTKKITSDEASGESQHTQYRSAAAVCST